MMTLTAISDICLTGLSEADQWTFPDAFLNHYLALQFCLPFQNHFLNFIIDYILIFEKYTLPLLTN